MLCLDCGDPLWAVQRHLWQILGLPPSGQLSQAHPLSSWLVAARIACVNAAELDRLHSPTTQLLQPLNPRLEAAALARLLQHQQLACGGCEQRQHQLQQMLAAYPSSCSVSSSQEEQMHALDSDASAPEAVLQRWVLSNAGASSSVTPAAFGASRLRGCAAAADLPAGAVVLQVPVQLLITNETAAASDFGKALSRLPGLDPETLAVLWTMVDRHDPESVHAPFWAALPPHFSTALSMPPALLGLARGLPVHAEAVSARAHVREQFDALQQTFMVLLQAYAAHLQPEWFSEAAFLWAVELWYAYAIQVKFLDGTIRPALVPLASLLNHSAAPHVVHFSTVDASSRALALRSFRPLQQGEQVCLSYGPLPNAHLLLFYGFALPDNPFDEVQLQLEVAAALAMLQEQQEQQPGEEGQAAAAASSSSRGSGAAAKEQLLQKLGLGLTHTLTSGTAQQPLPPGLLPCLRALCADERELQQLQGAVQQQQQQQQEASAHQSSSSNVQVEQATAAWGAAAAQAAVLGSPLSSGNEAAARRLLRRLLDGTRQPCQECCARIQQRRELQVRLQSCEQHPGGEAFVAALQAHAEGLGRLVERCWSVAAVGSGGE